MLLPLAAYLVWRCCLVFLVLVSPGVAEVSDNMMHVVVCVLACYLWQRTMGYNGVHKALDLIISCCPSWRRLSPKRTGSVAFSFRHRIAGSWNSHVFSSVAAGRTVPVDSACERDWDSVCPDGDLD